MPARPTRASATNAARLHSARVTGLAVAVLVATASAFLALRTDATVQASPTRVECRSGSLLYVLHLLTLDEQLFDLSSEEGARTDILLTRPEQSERLRRRVTRELGVDSIERLRGNRAETHERLRALGYL